MEEATKTATPTAPVKGVQVTEKALAKIRSAMVKEGISPEQGGLRLGVQGGGCSGLSYNIRFDTQPRERDRSAADRGPFEQLATRDLEVGHGVPSVESTMKVASGLQLSVSRSPGAAPSAPGRTFWT